MIWMWEAQQKTDNKWLKNIKNDCNNFFSVFLDNDSISWVNAFLTEIGDYEAKENNTP